MSLSNRHPPYTTRHNPNTTKLISVDYKALRGNKATQIHSGGLSTPKQYEATRSAKGPRKGKTTEGHPLSKGGPCVTSYCLCCGGQNVLFAKNPHDGGPNEEFRARFHSRLAKFLRNSFCGEGKKSVRWSSKEPILLIVYICVCKSSVDDC